MLKYFIVDKNEVAICKLPKKISQAPEEWCYVSNFYVIVYLMLFEMRLEILFFISIELNALIRMKLT